MEAHANDRHILCIDRGSATLKVAVYELGPERERLLLDGAVDAVDAPDAVLTLRDRRDAQPGESSRPLRGVGAISVLVARLAELRLPVDAVGHRLVYGGAAHDGPALVSDDVLATLATLVPFDPLHLPAALAAIREVAAALPGVAQVVCFDTAFHHRMPMVAQRLPLPRELWADGLRRYGYHGLSYESIVRELGRAGVRGATIVAHLGSGASLAALRNGKPIDTTMGFSPLGGLMMGTRPGDLDPGALLYLLRGGKYSATELDAVLTHHSGLLGVSQASADMHVLLERRATDEPAAEAVELFVYQAQKHIGALAAVLGGLDTLVFTGGIGEHSAVIRREICADLAFLGIELDSLRNAYGTGVISMDRAHVVVRVMAAQENLMVARHTFAVLAGVPDDDGRELMPATAD